MPVIGSLGKLVFSCSSRRCLSFSSKSTQISCNFVEHKPLNSAPVYEKVGTNATIINITVELLNSLNSPPEIYRSILEKMVLDGEEQILIIAGKYLGDFIIQNVDIEDKSFETDGSSIVATANLTLASVKNFTLNSLLDFASNIF